jgi:protein-tyrosine phosphatase
VGLIVFLGALSVGLFDLAWTHGGVAWALAWPSLSALLLVVAYAKSAPGLLGKRPDGTRPAWAWALFLPYFVFLGAAWRLEQLLGEDCWNEVAPGLYLGRRARARELPPDVRLVADLTAEFHEPAAVKEGRHYRCLPTLDARAPAAAAFVALVEQIASSPEPVYVHCASGHGRSATVAAAVLIRRGLARSPEDAETRLRASRPSVRLRPAQRALLAALHGGGRPEPGPLSPPTR